MKHRNTEIQKEIRGLKLEIFRLVQIIKEIEPHTPTKNPYQNTFENQIKHLDIEEKLLLKELIHCLTILNATSRETQKKTLISTREDNLNALEILLPKKLKITQKIITFKEQLEHLYSNTVFEKQEAIKHLKMSNTRFITYVQVLIKHGLIQHIGYEDRNFRKNCSLYQLITPKEYIAEKENIWETVFEPYKDINGFIEP